MGKYDDIINMPHHVSVRHPRMSMASRAAQFAPFAALVGHDDAVDQQAKTHIDDWNLTSGEGLERIEGDDPLWKEGEEWDDDYEVIPIPPEFDI